jgi:hypothetical protein
MDPFYSFHEPSASRAKIQAFTGSSLISDSPDHTNKRVREFYLIFINFTRQ